MRTIYLVSCVSKKKRGKHLAKDIYDSPWFKKARVYVEQRLQHADRWFILSAKHGLLDPDDAIEPYEKTLTRMKKEDRRNWAEQVINRLTSFTKQVDRIVILAGKRYRELLYDELSAICQYIEIPMEGMRIGEQLRWLTQQIDIIQ